ncbi:MAG: hypothetical protein GY931_14015 [Maribacter sp.]|nr:hypothetical protein [Maribacter sp.]
MKSPYKSTLVTLITLFLSVCSVNSQITENVYLSVQQKENKTIQHELKIDNGYLIHSVYETNPAKFIKTLGGFFNVENNQLVVQLEFNSTFEQDPVRQLIMPFKIEGVNLIIDMKSKMEFKPIEKNNQELDGQWLFGTRGPDKGQDRRGDSKPRKTLKFLQNGRFQWIAYNIETFKFSGTGGGSFTSKNGIYQENIEFFSRDDSRVGAELKFDYDLMENDWHHQGKNSRGEPMYEIWMRRSPK